MRRAPTRSEALLYALLRRDAAGFRFRRQVVIGRFIVDFFVASVGLIVEIDGGVHVGQADHDRLRQQALEALGYRVVRFSAEDVERDPHAVAAKIAAAVRGS
jgi:histidinol dehydrogenase